MKKVILDTNFLIYCAENKVDYETGIMELMNEGYELVVPELVIKELNYLSENEKKLSDRDAAKLALKILKANKIRVIKLPGKYADEAILRSVKEGNIAATLDLNLRRMLKNSLIIVIRGKRKIDFD